MEDERRDTKRGNFDCYKCYAPSNVTALKKIFGSKIGYSECSNVKL